MISRSSQLKRIHLDWKASLWFCALVLGLIWSNEVYSETASQTQQTASHANLSRFAPVEFQEVRSPSATQNESNKANLPLLFRLTLKESPMPTHEIENPTSSLLRSTAYLAPESVEEGIAISPSLKQDPFFSPTTAVIFRFGRSR